MGIRQLQRKGIRKGIVTIVHRRRKSARKIRHLPPFFQKEETFLIRKKFMLKYGFKVVDTINDEYELLALSFDGTQPQFTSNVRKQSIEGKELTIYYGVQCPYIPNCIEQIYNYCENNQIPLRLVEIDTLEKAKQLPCIFNNWAVFYNGKFETVHLLNEGLLKNCCYDN